MHARALQRIVKLQAELDQAKAEIRQLKAERFGKRSEKHTGTDRSNQLVDDSVRSNSEAVDQLADATSQNARDGDGSNQLADASVLPVADAAIQVVEPAVSQAAGGSNRVVDPQVRPTGKRKKGQQPGRPAPRRRDYSHLPSRETVVDLPEEAKVCAGCGLPLESIGFGDDHEQIEIETIIYRRVIRRKRYRRACECSAQPRTATAPLPDKLLPKSRYGTSIWVHLLLEKFHLQRPTQRTIEQLRLAGVRLAPGTIADGLKRVEPLMTPIYDAILAHHVQSNHFHADETRWKVFADKEGKVGHNWWLWLFAGKDSAVFVLDPSRSHDVPQKHFPDDVEGVLNVDRYSAYKAMQQVKSGKLALAFCWAHVRRDFVRVGKGYPELVAWALAWLSRIREAYRLNRERLKHAADSAEFAAADALLRQHMDSMAAQRDAELADAQLRAPCRKVLESLKEHWTGLTLFVTDPRVPMDNNYGERLIRNPAVGRKNYYGSGAEWAGRLAMMMFTIFATMLLWKINPKAWLTWYFDSCAANGGQPPSNPAEFLPWNLTPTRLAELQREHVASTSDTT